MTQIRWFTANDEPVSRRFDLSQNKYLRTLETTAASIIRAPAAASDFLGAVLSTTVPSLPLDVVIAYEDRDHGLFLREPRHIRVWHRCDPASDEHSKLFKVFREMHEVRSFRLVLCADVFGCVQMRSVRVLEQIVAIERKRGGLDYLQREPSIISEVRAPHPRPNNFSMGECD